MQFPSSASSTIEYHDDVTDKTSLLEPIAACYTPAVPIPDTHPKDTRPVLDSLEALKLFLSPPATSVCPDSDRRQAS